MTTILKSEFLPLSLDAIAGRGTRLEADYVLTDPPAALLPCDQFDRTRSLAGTAPSGLQSWTTVMNSRPGLTVEGVQCITPQVVRVRLIATASITVGTAVPSFAVIPGFDTRAIGPDPIVDRTYQRTIVRRKGDATLQDIQLAENRARDIASAENPLREAAGDVADAAKAVGVGAGVVLPLAIAAGAFLALR